MKILFERQKQINLVRQCSVNCIISIKFVLICMNQRCCDTWQWLCEETGADGINDLTKSNDESNGLIIVLSVSETSSWSIKPSSALLSTVWWMRLLWVWDFKAEWVASTVWRETLIAWERDWRDMSDNGSRVGAEGYGVFNAIFTTDKWRSFSDDAGCNKTSLEGKKRTSTR